MAAGSTILCRHAQEFRRAGTQSQRGATDLRLAVGAASAWIVLVLVSGRGLPTLCAVAGSALLVAVVGLAGPRRWVSRYGPGLAAAGFCILLVVAPYAARVWHARASPLAVLAARRAGVTAELTVTEDPHLLAATGVAGVPRVAVAATADVVTSRTDAWRVSGSVLVLGPAAPWQGVLPGQRVSLDGTLQPSLDGGASQVTLLAEGAPRLLGRPPWWQRGAGTVRASLQRAAAVLPDEERGLLPGLVDGDTSTLDPVLVQRFRIAGLTHLVAVSGTNCSILIGALLLVLRRSGVRPIACALIGAAALAAFVVVARPSPSVLRAAVMAAIALASLATGRPRQAIPALAAAVLVLLVWDPDLATDAGFSMSALATAALLLIAPSWAEALRRRRVPPGVAEALAVAAAAHLVTAPVIAAISGRVSVVAIPANVLAEPAVPVATVLGFVAALLSPFWLLGGQGLAWLAGWPCRWLVKVADEAGGLTGASLPWPGGTSGGLALLAVVGALVLLARRAGMLRTLVAAVLVGLLVQIPVRTAASGWPPRGWLMVACDIGQGDAIVLNAGSGTAVEIDAGPDPVAVDRCLRQLGIHRIALLVLSHYHLDHVGGFVGVFHDRSVDRVITGPLAEPASGAALVRRTLVAHRLGISTPPVGTGYDVGPVHLDVLAPAAAFHETRSDPNNSSLVLRATIGGVRILLPGDAEIEAQQALLASGTDLRADILKVPHHGSAYSDPAFLAAVHAEVGVISVGLHNDYGHPSPILLNELARLGVPVRRTDHDGDVAVTGTPGHVSTVLHGTAATTAAGPPALRELRPAAPSEAGARMESWRARSPSTISPRPSRPSCCSWGTRSCCSPGPSARSPPRFAGRRRISSRPRRPARYWRAPSCTSCSDRRCSVTPG